MRKFSLPKDSLLRKPREYNLVYRKGKRIQGNHFNLIFTPNTKQVNRLGISIHGQLKGAVRRNRIKRIIREFFRTNRDFLQTRNKNGCASLTMDIVFTVRKGFRLNSPAEVGNAVYGLIARTGSTNAPDRNRSEIEGAANLLHRTN
jgi:ribonuclease P protein component